MGTASAQVAGRFLRRKVRRVARQEALEVKAGRPSGVVRAARFALLGALLLLLLLAPATSFAALPSLPTPTSPLPAAPGTSTPKPATAALPATSTPAAPAPT